MRSHLKPVLAGTLVALAGTALTAVPASAQRYDSTRDYGRSSHYDDSDRDGGSFEMGYRDGRYDMREDMRQESRRDSRRDSHMSSRDDDRSDNTSSDDDQSGDRLDRYEYGRGYRMGRSDEGRQGDASSESRRSGTSTERTSMRPSPVAVLVVERDRQRAAMQQLKAHLQEARTALQSGDQQKAQLLLNTADRSVQQALQSADMWQKVDQNLEKADQALSSNNRDEAQKALREARMDLSGQSSGSGSDGSTTASGSTGGSNPAVPATGSAAGTAAGTPGRTGTR